MIDIELRIAEERLDELVEEYASKCAKKELETKGHIDPAGKRLWALEYMSEFIERLPDDLFKDVDLDEESIQDKAKSRFLNWFDVYWEEARYKLT